MIGDKKTPRIVLQNAYRMAVQALIVEVFHASEAKASKAVSDWWKGVSTSVAMRSGSFLHVDPIQTAAELSGSAERDLTVHEDRMYRRILETTLQQAKREFISEGNTQLVVMQKAIPEAISLQENPPLSISKQALAGSRR
jgi:hypothetical protein